MKQLVIGAALGLTLGVVGTSLAQQGPHQDHGTTAAAGAAEEAYRAASAKMHGAMAIKYTGDPDKDFVAGMIPHHQGAIDMAQVELKFGKDPALRKMAEAVIRDQTREIAEMKAWQANNR
jgi:uncharacterized protein (DUF305 family)